MPEVPELFVAIDGKTPEAVAQITGVISQVSSQVEGKVRLGVKFNDLTPTVNYRELRDMMELNPGLWLFLDPKWADIPHTDANHMEKLLAAVGDITRYVTFNAWSFAKPWTYRQYMSPLLKGYPNLYTLIITYLTSKGNAEARREHGKPAKQVVLDVASAGLIEWFGGTISSGEEIRALRQINGNRFPDFRGITPGIRFAWSIKGDQDRVVTPNEAMRDGANGVVMGRDILKNESWLSALDAVNKFIQEVHGVTYINSKDSTIDGEFEELLRHGTLDELLVYIWAKYDRPDDFPEWYGYIRWDSWAITNKYTNLAVLESYPQLLRRVAIELADKIDPLLDAKKEPPIVIWAAQWSVRLSGELWAMLGGRSIYMEKWKDGSMVLDRHSIPTDRPIDVVVSEDTISRWGTVAKMIETLKNYPNVTIKAIVAVAQNKIWLKEFDYPVISLLEIDPPSEMFHDETSFSKWWILRHEADCAKLLSYAPFPHPSERVGSGKKYVAKLQQLAEYNNWKLSDTDFEWIITQK